MKRFFKTTIEPCGYVGESNSGLWASCVQVKRFLWGFSVTCAQLVHNPACCCAHIRPHIHRAYLKQKIKKARSVGLPGGSGFIRSRSVSSFFMYINSRIHAINAGFKNPSSGVSAALYMRSRSLASHILC